MDTMSKSELEAVLSSRLPQCTIICSINPDSTMTVEVTGSELQQFTVANIDRTLHHGEKGIAKITREILEDMVVARQTSRLK